MECGAPLSEGRERRRKLATVVFCDVAGSTALAERIDAEALRELMIEYFGEMRRVLESHGGVVEKFIGDAVVGVFGIPVGHEDDALRGVRAASEMQARLASLNADLNRRFGAHLSLRIGVNTGEVVAGDQDAPELVLGDTANVAARLQQKAPVDGVLLGATTFELVRRAVEAEALPPLTVKGKTAPLRAYQLVAVRPEADGRPRRGASFVGRETELAVMASLLDRVRSSGRPVRALVLGEAGVGKSRLVEAALEPLGEAVEVITVRCLAYGQDITYFPLVQLVRQAARIGEGHEPHDARSRIDSLFAGVPDAESAGAILAQVLGLAEGAASADEIGWAARRLTELLASSRPLVLIAEDLQWAKEPFVELLTGIADRARAPVLVLCLARPEFAAAHREWIADLHLQPLAQDDAQALMRRLVPGRRLAADAEQRLLSAAGGNPLFLEELVAYVGAGGEPVDLPPTLDALISARLDARPRPERRTLECASVEGEVFHRGAVLALTAPGERSTVDDSLARLTADELVQPTLAALAGEEGYAFHHLLVRDAAYRGMSKRRRAALHLQFADWLDTKLGLRIAEVAEIAGYHLEQAWRLRSELGPLDDDTRAVGARAAELLSGAAWRSLARGDAAAAFNLFTRAEALAPDEQTRIEIALNRGIAARELSEFAVSRRVLDAVELDATRAGLDVIAARARLELALLQLRLRPAETAAPLRRVGEETLRTFELRNDELGRAVAFSALALERWVALRCAEAGRLLEQALVHAERAGDDRLTASLLVELARAIVFGPLLVSDAAKRCEELLSRADRIGPATGAEIMIRLAVLEATRGRPERARELVRTSIDVLEETAARRRVAGAEQYAGLAELTLGDADRAEHHLRRSFEQLERLGERAVASSSAALLSRALVELGRFDEGERFASVALDWGGEDDIVTQAYARSALAFVFVARGAVDDARREALAAVEVSASSDFTNQRGDAFFDLALVQRACGDEPAARLAATEARACFAVKGNLDGAERATIIADGRLA
jgi:class 3 adenylate cyclase/tetratricopeptide (TPR) repeat protein